MRTTISIVVILIFLTFASSIVIAQPSFGNWLDIRAEEEYSNYLQPSCIYPVPGIPNQSFNCYFFAACRDDNFISTECKIILPDPVMSISSVVYHPNVNLADGDWLTGIVLNFDQCMTELSIMVATIEIQIGPPGLQPGCMLIEMCPADGTNFFGIKTCEPGNPEVDANHTCDILVNCEPCPDIATEALNWGAIKGLYKY